ncbi:MAG: hypothetical protein IJ419_14705 [Agathobacter sp.]|nr:hypothetical protein [Agathobacter sp.]
MYSDSLYNRITLYYHDKWEGLLEDKLPLGVNPYSSLVAYLTYDSEGYKLYNTNLIGDMRYLSIEDMEAFDVMLAPAIELRDKINSLKDVIDSMATPHTETEKYIVWSKEIELSVMKVNLKHLVSHIGYDFGKTIGLL